MKRVLFFLLMIFVSFGVIADCEIQAKDHDLGEILAKMKQRTSRGIRK